MIHLTFPLISQVFTSVVLIDTSPFLYFGKDLEFHYSMWLLLLSVLFELFYRFYPVTDVGRGGCFPTCHHINTGSSPFYSKRWRTSRRSTWSAANSLTAWLPNLLSTPTRKSHQAPRDPSRVRTQKHTKQTIRWCSYLIDFLRWIQVKTVMLWSNICSVVRW